MVTDTQDPFKDYFDFLGFRKLSDQPSRILSSIRKYSGTISIASTIAALIAFTTFSIQPVIVSIAGFAFTPAPLAFIPLAVLLFTAVINFINTQKIKENEIDKKVGNCQVDEQYSQIVQEAEKIEIVTNLDRKRKKLLIVLPISKTQREILEDIKAENRNRIFLFTGSYVFGAIIVVSAISQSINVPITLISLLVVVLVCIISTLSNLISNSVDHENHTIRNHSTLGLLLPYWSGKGMVVSVIENKLGKKENELISLMKELLSPFCDSFGSNLKKACDLLDNSLLKPASIDIKETLNDIRGDLKVLLNNLEEIIEQDVDKVKKNANTEITTCLKGISKSIGESLKEIRTELKEKLNQLQPSGIGNYLVKFVPTTSNRQAGNTGDSHDQNHSLESDDDEEEFFDCFALTEENKKEIIQEVRKIINDVVRNKLEPIQEQLATLQANGSPDSALGSEDVDNIDQFPLTLEDTVKARRKTVRNLELEEENNRLIKKEQKLTQRKPEQEKTDEWKEKINGKPSDFLYYLLESIKLEEKDNKEKKVEATLRDFDNKVTIYWKDGSQTICHIKKQGDLQIESSATMFTDPNVQAAWEMARGKSL
ncbi:hypothetical protein CLD06_05815 [Wolbachia endosymbiont of Drosophila subpulchrella]|uniref:hypothetical protein n=1 Tax=Wolbachia endosymbiont of Drosophila subpulchrella TaxID=2033655 RepID=UPI000BB1293F|nr:hypothetical protein [Wolbachia endosymbiont of Drosophila subpulchrella]PBD15473.1 hypothetical protein CLD06_05815 [Wolbachia endosymbiont of Drosophila subpulchrella]